MSDDDDYEPPGLALNRVFGALADPTRRELLLYLARTESATAPELNEIVGMSRQGLGKHLQVLGAAGLVERDPTRTRPVVYRLTPAALDPAADWIRAADHAWIERLERLRRAAERW